MTNKLDYDKRIQAKKFYRAVYLDFGQSEIKEAEDCEHEGCDRGTAADICDDFKMMFFLICQLIKQKP